MRGRLWNTWENVSASLWFIPSVLVLAALVASSVLIEVDVVLAERADPLIPWLFSGTADAARTVLSVVAGSLITVISIAFSITIVAIQQAASQFTPRVLRAFTSSRTNQVVLGAYTATFIYALLVLRSVRTAEENTGAGFVPALSVTVALVLALICLGLLIYFIHHMSQSLQVAVIMDHVRRELIEQIDELYPPDAVSNRHDSPLPDSWTDARAHDTKFHTIRSTHTGFVRGIDVQALQELPLGSARWLLIQPHVGEFVTYDGTLAQVDRLDGQAEDFAERIRDAFVIDNMRTINQDPLFGIRQLVDIALKALSPGINDMTTAEYVLYHLGDALGRLADRPFPPMTHPANHGQTNILVKQPSWDDFVDTAFSQIRHAARSDVHVTATLLQVLRDLALHISTVDRQRAVQHQVTEVRYILESDSFSPADQALLRERADAVDRALWTQLAVPEPR